MSARPDTTASPAAERGPAATPARRGFASLTPERRRAVASMGGRAAHALGKAHKFTGERARAAGRRGGLAVSRDRAHMAAIGRKGGCAPHANRAAAVVVVVA